MGAFGWSYPAGAENDPLAPYNQTDDDTLYQDKLRLIEALRTRTEKQLPEREEGTHCYLTGKDSDLEPTGQQSIELVAVTERREPCLCVTNERGELIPGAEWETGYWADGEVTIYATYSGSDVSLNLPPDVTPEEEEACVQRYLALSESVIPERGSTWDGECWGVVACAGIEVPLVLNPDTDELMVEETVDAIIEAARTALAPLEATFVEMSSKLDVLAGWKTLTPEGEIVDCPEGQPGPDSAYALLNP